MTIGDHYDLRVPRKTRNASVIVETNSTAKAPQAKITNNEIIQLVSSAATPVPWE
jgi:hypothetical protein